MKIVNREKARDVKGLVEGVSQFKKKGKEEESVTRIWDREDQEVQRSERNHG